MQVHLRVLHGHLKRQDGSNLGPDIRVKGKRFIIGSGAECHMRCPSSTISEYHCELVAEGNVVLLRDLRSEGGTFLNDELITTSRPVANGDHIRIGKLEFEVVMPEPAAPPVGARPRSDSVGDNISEMLSAADEEERSRLRDDPTSRYYQSPVAGTGTSTDSGKKKLERPPARPPIKLPPPPKMVAESTVNAAEEVLKKFFEKPKK